MADFKPSFLTTIGHEIGWVDNPLDAGGETYNGIARRFHPDNIVWQWIDAAKVEPGFPDNIPHTKMRGIVEQFYKAKFWDKIRGDDVPDQNIAGWLFDIAVNGGVNRAGNYLQTSLNALNRNERDYDDLVVDGKIGPKTITTLKKYMVKRDSNGILFWLAVQMGSHWLKRSANKPDQEEFLNGITNRWLANIENVADKFYLT